MDGNTLIEVIKSGIPMINSSLSAIVGAVVTTLFLRRNTRVTEFEKIKAGKFSELIDELLKNGKMSYLEYYKCTNFLQIAQKADTMYQEKESTEPKYYDFDWFIRFFEYSSNVSNDDMQALWAKILAGEVQNPNSTSITLLNTLSMMRQEQAQFFCNISRFALMDMDISKNLAHLLIFVSTNREAYERENITPTTLKNLERLGLLECNFLDEYVFMNKKIFRTGNKIITVYGDPSNQGKIKAGNIKFSEDGQLLYSALDNDLKRYRGDILDFTITRFQKRNCRVTINGREVK